MNRFFWCALCVNFGLVGCGDDSSVMDAGGDAGPVDASSEDAAVEDTGPVDCTGASDGTPCGVDMVCSAEMCVEAGCGDGILTDDEECDDMNGLNGDGCEADCTYSCSLDDDCNDANACNGVETCDITTHVCQVGMLMDCTDGDECTDDLCDGMTGTCVNPLIDMDGDGQASTDLGACGTDCDDTRDDVFEGAEELCDGIDNNCNADIDEVAPTWYVDCDMDGFAADTGSSRTGCTEPPSVATGCDGGWVTLRPLNQTNTDCNDSHPNMFPGQTDYFTSPHTGTATGDDARYGNYNCNGRAEFNLATRTNANGSCGLYPNYFVPPTCLGTGWAGSSSLSCGYSGNYYDCGGPEECPFDTPARCRNYTLVCVGSPLPGGACSVERDCIPGSSGCPWHYYRCSDSVDPSRETMACR